MVFCNFFKHKQQQKQQKKNEQHDIYGEKEVKVKVKRRKRTSASTTDIDTSDILAQPFPPMYSRAKSPSDILDFVGYPKPIPSPGLVQNDKSNDISPMTFYHQLPPIALNAPLTVRNKTPKKSSPSNSPQHISNLNNKTASSPKKEITLSSLSSSSTIVYSQNRATLSSPSLLQMPTPKKIKPPTYRILNADQNDKTLVIEDQLTKKETLSFDEVEKLKQQMREIQIERQDWIRLQNEQRKVEEDLLLRIKENQAKINELSLQQKNLLKDRHSIQLSTPSYTQDESSENDEDDIVNENSLYYRQHEDTFYNENNGQEISYLDPVSYEFQQLCHQHQPDYLNTKQHHSSHYSESSSGYYSDEEEDNDGYDQEIDGESDDNEEDSYFSIPALYNYWHGQRLIKPSSSRYMDYNCYWPHHLQLRSNGMMMIPPIQRDNRKYTRPNISSPSMINPTWFHRPDSTRLTTQQYDRSLSPPLLRRYHSLGDDQFNT
ncbi:unnamed protein product [Cunninghamella blakesleeana]